MQSKAKTVVEYLKALPADRREAIEAVREVIVANVDADIEEGMQYGAIGYYVPHRVFANGYHCDPSQPLPFIGLASQKQHMAAYLMFAYMGGPADEAWIRQAYAKTGRKLDMGKSCIRFRSIGEIDLEILAEAIRRTPTKGYVERYVSMVPAGAWKSKRTTPAAGATAKKVVKKVVKKTVKKVAKNAVKKAAKKK